MCNKSSRISIFAFFLLLYGCSSFAEEVSNEKSVKDAYEQYYMQYIHGAVLDKLVEQWDEQARSVFTISDRNSGAGRSLDVHENALRYPGLFVADSFEIRGTTATGREACLLLVGKAIDGDFLALNVAFSRDDERWLHSELFAYYFDDEGELPSRPDCASPKPPHL